LKRRYRNGLNEIQCIADGLLLFIDTVS